MRLIEISEYDYKSMTLIKPVYDAQKRILLTAGRTIDPKITPILEAIGIKYLFIEDEVSKGISIEDMLDMPTWTDTIDVMKSFYEQVKNKDKLDLRSIFQIATKLLDEVKQRPTFVLIPSGTVATELQPYAHAINVTLLSLLTGKRLGYNDLNMKELAIGSLLHDIGKALTDDNDQHTEVGFNFLRDIHQFSLVSAHIAYQHHESINGEGVPRHIKNNEFLEFAQICGASNKYDNLITKEKLPPHEAMEAIMATSDRSFSHRVVNAFCLSVATYPPGTKVLIDKYPAIVTQLNKHLHRPVVKMLSNDQEIDLTEYPTYMIEPDKPK
ncbi:HD-GYP domain-containing protein [Aquibacillus sediminis]|uniref:HD-GYP domain-containing protein n=1 Tax=Aquibacillus sediminis TaxID=2574734 RepID=UPI00110824A2|nr:HD domain-containing phosphohydrolase [Aquibacillus sediminis]